MIKKIIKNFLNKSQLDILINLKKKIINCTQRISKEDLIKLKIYEDDFPKVMSTQETLQWIIDNNSSLCRYGDAEFDICEKLNKNDSYQKPSQELTERLTKIIKTPINKKLLICIPPFNSKYNNIKNFYGKLSFWEYFWLKRYDNLKKYFIYNNYGNSFISRENVFYENDISDIKKIWNKREIVFVYGNNGRFKFQNELFDNISSYEEILISPTHAFDDYENILSKCLNYTKKKLFLIAAGPTATILAFDLCKKGYQALDIGHFPNCYDQYKGLIDSPESLPRIK